MGVRPPRLTVYYPTGAAVDATRSGTESRSENAVARSSARRIMADGCAGANVQEETQLRHGAVFATS